MNQELAKQVALESTTKYDFDRREVLTCNKLDGETVEAMCLQKPESTTEGAARDYYEVIVRVFCSDERIKSLIEATDSPDDIAMKQDYLGGGSKVRVIVASGNVVREELLGVQLS